MNTLYQPKTQVCFTISDLLAFSVQCDAIPNGLIFTTNIFVGILWIFLPFKFSASISGGYHETHDCRRYYFWPARGSYTA